MHGNARDIGFDIDNEERSIPNHFIEIVGSTTSYLVLAWLCNDQKIDAQDTTNKPFIGKTLSLIHIPNHLL